MSNDPIPSHDQISALAALVGDGTLTHEQREQTAVVLGMIGSALRIAAQASEQHSNDPAAAHASVAGSWQPVATEYGRLLQGTGAKPRADRR